MLMVAHDGFALSLSPGGNGGFFLMVFFFWVEVACDCGFVVASGVGLF